MKEVGFSSCHLLNLNHNLINGFLPLNLLQLAFGAAALNIQIPLMLGNLVNVIAQYMREHVGNYMRDIRAPALKLLGLYGLQVRLFKSVSTPVSRFVSRVVTLMVAHNPKDKYLDKPLP